MTDNYALSGNAGRGGLESPGTRHTAISADADPIDPRPRAIFCQAAGTFTATDENDTSLSYTMAQGTVIPFRFVAITAIDSGTFYGWD